MKDFQDEYLRYTPMGTSQITLESRDAPPGVPNVALCACLLLFWESVSLDTRSEASKPFRMAKQDWQAGMLQRTQRWRFDNQTSLVQTPEIQFGPSRDHPSDAPHETEWLQGVLLGGGGAPSISFQALHKTPKSSHGGTGAHPKPLQ